MKRLILLFLMCGPVFVWSQPQFDTVMTKTVGPGVVYQKMIEPNRPWSVDVLQVDLTQPYIRIESVKARDRLHALERTRSMVARSNTQEQFVVGAVNADFYGGTGVPIGPQVIAGECLKKPSSRTTIGFTRDNHVSISTPIFNSWVQVNGQGRYLSDVNGVRKTDTIVLYNSYFGESTDTNQWGTEVLLSPLDHWFVNDTVRCVADSVAYLQGNMDIPEGHAVLSGHGTSSDFLHNRVSKGDTLSLFIGIQPGHEQLWTMVGGLPRLVNAGQNVADPDDFSSGFFGRNPRTAAGISADSTTLYLVTVDGRQSSSDGMSLDELSKFLIDLGAYHAINLDGGGSTTMVVRGEVMNSPSDPGGERSVANALLVTSRAPRGPVVQLEIEPNNIRLLPGDTLQFSVTGLDEFYYPTFLSTLELDFEQSRPLGSIDSSGRFVAGTERDSGYVIISYNDVVDSARIVIKSIKQVSIHPRDVVIDTLDSILFSSMVLDSDGENRTVMPQWGLTDSTVGTISETGLFRGQKSGETGLIADFRGVTDTVFISVQVGVGTTQIDSVESLQGWSVSHLNCDPDSTTLSLSSEYTTLGTSSVRGHYGFTFESGTEYWMYLNTDLPVYGVPDSLQVDVRLDDRLHSVYLIVEDAMGNTFRLRPRRRPRNRQAFNRVGVRAAEPALLGEAYYFPIRIKQIAISLDSESIAGHFFSGSLYVDNIRATYPAKMVTSVPWSMKPRSQSPDSYTVLKGYPNPFNNRTQIQFTLYRKRDLDVHVFDVLGRNVRTLWSGDLGAGEHKLIFDAIDLASGIYFVHMDPPVAAPLKLSLIK